MTMKNREKIGKMEKNKKNSIILIFFFYKLLVRKWFGQGSWWFVLFFRFIRISKQVEFLFKGEWFLPKAYTCCILPMLSMIVMKMAKLYVLYEYIIIYYYINGLRFMHGTILLAY